MERRYFVNVIAPDQAALQRLHQYGLDFFQASARVTERKEVVLARAQGAARTAPLQPTAKTREAREFVVDGLLSLDEVGRLVEDGYAVLVQERDVQRARARAQVIEFQEWLKGMQE